MVRKRIIRWMAGVVLIALLSFTVISNSVYQASLPRVRTQIFEATIEELLDGYGLWETLNWVPKECVFPSGSEGKVCLYRINQRAGQFARVEYCVEKIEAPVLEEREDAVLVGDLYLGLTETLVCETNLPLMDGQTVIWLNGDEPDT